VQTDSAVIKIVLATLVVGVAIPLLLQLFLTLRRLQHLVATLDRRLDPALRDLADVISDFKPRPRASHAEIATVIAAAVPALVAGIRAFRSTDKPDGSADGNSVPLQPPVQEELR
jgi:hypothetical protein